MISYVSNDVECGKARLVREEDEPEGPTPQEHSGAGGGGEGAGEHRGPAPHLPPPTHARGERTQTTAQTAADREAHPDRARPHGGR